MIESIRESDHFKTFERRFYISSCKADAKSLLDASPKHWAIENSLHWTLDVTFREDESRIRVGAAPENYAIFKNIALNILRKDVSVDASIKRKKLMAALNDEIRTKIIMGVI